MKQISESQRASMKDYKQFELVAAKFLIDFYSTIQVDSYFPALLAACATQKTFLVLSKLKCFRKTSKSKNEFGEETISP